MFYRPLFCSSLNVFSLSLACRQLISLLTPSSLSCLLLNFFLKLIFLPVSLLIYFNGLHVLFGLPAAPLHRPRRINKIAFPISHLPRQPRGPGRTGRLHEYLSNHKDYPANSELSECGLAWSTVHFCCRFDAPCCLEYYLRKCYIQDLNEYLYMVNQRTKEGYTCLHLCAIWGAEKCFTLLVKYGGLNLAIKDNKSQRIWDLARDYRREDMRKTLTRLRKVNGYVTRWNFELLALSPEL